MLRVQRGQALPPSIIVVVLPDKLDLVAVLAVQALVMDDDGWIMDDDDNDGWFYKQKHYLNLFIKKQPKHASTANPFFWVAALAFI